MQKFESELFGRLEAPETFDELLRLVLHPKYMTSFNVWMWRGQADATRRIDSAAFRRCRENGENPRNVKLEYYEENLIKRARHRGFDIIDGQRLSDFDLLARLQHHGAATRLLDATRSAFVALYFSCSQFPTVPGMLFGIHAYELGGYEGEPIEGDYRTVVEGLAKYDHALTWEPPSVSARIAAQHSQFIYSDVSEDERGSIVLGSDRERFLAIPITPELKKASLKILKETFDIREFTLFPDLDGFASHNSSRHPKFNYGRW